MKERARQAAEYRANQTPDPEEDIPSEVPEGSLRGAAGELSVRARSLTQIAHELEERLGAVLADPRPAETAKGTEPCGQCGLATELLRTSQKFGHVEDKLTELLERLGI